MGQTTITERQNQILVRLLQGEKRSAIASDLGIHINTVDFHIAKLRRRVGVNGSLAQLVVWYSANCVPRPD